MVIRDEYLVTAPNTNYALCIKAINDHMKTNFVSFESEPYLGLLVKCVEKFGENFTRRVFLNKTFTNYKPCFFVPNHKERFRNTIELRRSKLSSIVSVKYIDENEDEQTIDSSFYSSTISDEYSSLYFTSNFNLPTISSSNPQPVRIEFIAGYGDTSESIPSSILTAMLNHLAILWQNRGDCITSTGAVSDSNISKMLPETSRMLYSMETIQDYTL